MPEGGTTLKKLLITLIALVALALVPSALASGKVSADTCPTDVSSLIANVTLTPNPGGVSTATFTIPAGCIVKVSLVSYTAASATFTWDNASQEAVDDQVTENLGAGTHTMSVKTPNCYYQVDLVEGEVIAQFGPYATNPGNFYTPQGRLAASANGGDNACVAAAVVPAAPLVAPVTTQVKAKKIHRHHKTVKKPKTLPYTP